MLLEVQKMFVDGSIDQDQMLFVRYTARGLRCPLKCAHDVYAW